MAEVAQNPNFVVWSAGDWDQVADFVKGVGPRLLDRLGVSEGERLLDIGTGSGSSVAIPAAKRGAKVVASDLVEAWLEAGKRRAAAEGVELEWAEADAQALPFQDDSFDVVTSTFGHMFAPDHAAAAREMVRVCKPGGRIGFAAWTPDGKVGQMFASLAAFAPPPPPGFQPPPLWGTEAHVRELLEPLGVEVETSVEHNDFFHPDLETYMEEFENNFGPIVTMRNNTGERWPEAQAALRAYSREVNEATDGSYRLKGAYLQVVGKVS